jgi:hypothetical protein
MSPRRCLLPLRENFLYTLKAGATVTGAPAPPSR